MATIRKTTYRCDACGEPVPRKKELRPFTLLYGPTPSGYRASRPVIKAEFCAACDDKFVAALVPFFGEGATKVRRDGGETA
jgi:hypothetical protein